MLAIVIASATLCLLHAGIRAGRGAAAVARRLRRRTRHFSRVLPVGASAMGIDRHDRRSRSSGARRCVHGCLSQSFAFRSLSPPRSARLSIVATLAVVAVLVRYRVCFPVDPGRRRACALCAVVVERYPATWSLRLTVERVFNRQSFGARCFAPLRLPRSGLAASTLVDCRCLCRFIALAGRLRRRRCDRTDRRRVPFLGAFFAVYYFDVRIRHEG